MTWKIKYKYHQFKKSVIANTYVEIEHEDNSTLTAILDIEALNRDDEDIIKEVLENFYQRTYIGRAEKEKLSELTIESEKNKLEVEKTKIMSNQNSRFMSLIASIVVANDRNLWPGQYDAIVSFVPGIKAGVEYHNGDIVRIKDNRKKQANDKSGLEILCVIRKDYVWDGQEDISTIANPYKNGFDLRSYPAYPRVQLGTANDTKK